MQVKKFVHNHAELCPTHLISSKDSIRTPLLWQDPYWAKYSKYLMIQLFPLHDIIISALSIHAHIIIVRRLATQTVRYHNRYVEEAHTTKVSYSTLHLNLCFQLTDYRFSIHLCIGGSFQILNTMATAAVLASEKERFYEYNSATKAIFFDANHCIRDLDEIVAVILKNVETIAKVHKDFICAKETLWPDFSSIKPQWRCGRSKRTLWNWH